MKPTTLKERLGLDEDALFEEGDNAVDAMTDEELKIESLKIATNIAKLMSGVTPEDIVNIAETVAKFIKDGANGSLESSSSDEDKEEPVIDEEPEEQKDFEESDETEEPTEEPEGDEDFTV